MCRPIGRLAVTRVRAAGGWTIAEGAAGSGGLWACFEGSTRAPADSGVDGGYSSQWRPVARRPALSSAPPLGPL